MPAPVASGGSGRRVGLAPTGKAPPCHGARGMHVWVWGERYPHYMDALVPMASQPTAMASRNWMLRRMMLETIRNDPDYNNGNYVDQPRALKYARVFYVIATAGGTLHYQSTLQRANWLIRSLMLGLSPR